MADLFKGKYRIQSARCPKWDYSSEGAYFITICTDRREHFFGIIENQTVKLSEAGQIAEKLWTELPLHFPFIKLDVFVIMPNHIHVANFPQTRIIIKRCQILQICMLESDKQNESRFEF